MLTLMQFTKLYLYYKRLQIVVFYVRVFPPTGAKIQAVTSNVSQKDEFLPVRSITFRLGVLFVPNKSV